MWQADSIEEAIERAEAEAVEYAGVIEEAPHTYLGLAQAFWMFDEPGDGAEVFSLVRVSKQAPTAYLDRFFDTGRERQSRSVEAGPETGEG